MIKIIEKWESGKGNNLYFINTLIIFFLATILLINLGCGEKAGNGIKYHCPMHPTYISDSPGDCPICGMRLVPIENKTETKKHQIYECPMHPEVTSDAPGRCPKCGMELVAVKEIDSKSNKEQTNESSGIMKSHEQHLMGGASPSSSENEAAGGEPVVLDESSISLAGIRSSVAVKDKIIFEIRTVGNVIPDETRVKHIHTKISGWIEKLLINFTGQQVKKAEQILEIYSPEILSSQQEYLEAKKILSGFANSDFNEARKGSEEIFEAARKRLELLDMPESFFQELDRTGTPSKTISLLSPVSGFITSKSIFQGQEVEPGMELYTVTDLTSVWIEADFYEYESHYVEIGQKANISFPYIPGRYLEGRVSYIYPYLNQESRTLKVRFEFDNRDGILKPSMFVDVFLKIESPETVLIDDSAIMDSGLRKVVFVKQAGNSFEPREVQVGIRSNGKAQILQGLAEGEEVVTHANFLLDSESRLRAAISAMR